MTEQDGLRPDFLKAGEISSFTTPALSICGQDGCRSEVTVVTIYHILGANRLLKVLCYQACGRHAEENEAWLRARYTWRPPAVIWSD
jgi:hypothetical protein